jgi:error-prone DNA polymerase
MTTGPHLVEHWRKRLASQGILSASELKALPNGRRVRTAGAVIVRQRPGTAKGFVFLTLEDETGMCQAIVRPDLFKEQRAVIVGSGTLIVEGKLQNDGTLSVRAEKFWPISQVETVPSHDFR